MQRQVADGAPVVLIATPQRRAELDERLREKLPHLAEHLDHLCSARGVPALDPDELVGTVIGTRQFAREFIEQHPEVDADAPLLIDCMWAEVLTSPVINELLDTWPKAEFFNCNEDVAETVALVVKRRRDAA